MCSSVCLFVSFLCLSTIISFILTPIPKLFFLPNFFLTIKNDVLYFVLLCLLNYRKERKKTLKIPSNHNRLMQMPSCNIFLSKNVPEIITLISFYNFFASFSFYPSGSVLRTFNFSRFIHFCLTFVNDRFASDKQRKKLKKKKRFNREYDILTNTIDDDTVFIDFLLLFFHLSVP